MISCLITLYLNPFERFKVLSDCSAVLHIIQIKSFDFKKEMLEKLLANLLISIIIGGQYVPVSNDLLHPLLKELRSKMVDRYVVWDKEDIESYMKDVCQDVHVEVHVKCQVFPTTQF